ncbi:hypothetical protein Bca52824_031201 [Brassica carinata]|uniref:Uncharacterized protein n=1 Tax=Brassica carinata TaxID=52824 RepID=A0A8X7V3Z0_BRACI|nr:hypothetical protein Bca52824_031201 [Brassica carinata]
MDSEWWDDREKEIQYAKKIRENGIPHMELMRRIFRRQGSKPEAMYSTHVQDAEKNERQDKSVPETQDNDGDHTTDVHHHPQTISIDSPPRSPIGPSKRSNRKQRRAAPYKTSRGKDVALGREKNIPQRRKSFEKEINEQFKEMMELRRSQVAEAKERREKNEARPFKEAYEALQRCHGDLSSANPEQNIIRTTTESHSEFAVPSRSELMSLFEEVGYKRGYGKMGEGGGIE